MHWILHSIFCILHSSVRTRLTCRRTGRGVNAMQFFHPVLIGFSPVLPFAAATTAGLMSRRTKSRKPIRDFTATCISALVLSIGFNAVYAYQSRCTVRVGQILLTAYLAVAVLVILKAASSGLKTGLSWFFRVNAAPSPEK